MIPTVVNSSVGLKISKKIDAQDIESRGHYLIAGEKLTDGVFDRKLDKLTTRDIDLSGLTRLPSRPLMGKEAAEVVPVRIEPAIVKSMDRRAQRKEKARSDIIHQALSKYLAS